MLRAVKASHVFFKIMLVGLSAALLAACPPPHEPLNLAGNNWLGYQPFYVATELNTDAAQEPEFSIHTLPATSNVLRLMSEGQLDGGFLTLDEALTYQQNAKDKLCVAMVTNVSRGGDALIMRPGWRQRPEPLRIAHEATAVGGYLLSRATQLHVFKGKEIEPVVATLNRHAELFKSGQIDGVITFHPVLGRLEREESEIIFDSDMIAGDVVDLLVIKQSAWLRHGSHIQSSLLQLWHQSVDKFDALPADVGRILSANTGLSYRELRLALSDIELIGATTADEFDLSTAINSIQQFLLESGHLSKRQSLNYCQHQDR